MKRPTKPMDDLLMHALAASHVEREYPPRLLHANLILKMHVIEGLERRGFITETGAYEDRVLTDEGIEYAYRALLRQRARDSSAALRDAEANGTPPGTFVRSARLGVVRVDSVSRRDPSGLHHVAGSVTVARVRSLSGVESSTPLSMLRPLPVSAVIQPFGRAEVSVHARGNDDYTTAYREWRTGERYPRTTLLRATSLRAALLRALAMARVRSGTAITPVPVAHLTDIGRSVLSLGCDSGRLWLMERTVGSRRPYENRRVFTHPAHLNAAISDRFHQAWENEGTVRSIDAPHT